MRRRNVRQLFKTAHMKVAEFRAGRTRQPDDQFVADCGLAPRSEAARVALAVRRAVASIGLIDPLYIRAGDAYPDQLGVLPLWDSMDWVALVMELEQELDTRITDEEAAQLFDPDRVSVKEMVAAASQLLVSRGEA
jgi:acyl carrier protein